LPAPASGQVEVRVLERLGGHADEWDRLVDLAPLPSPFLRSWWLESVAQDVTARFVLVLDAGRLIGGLALEETARRGIPVLRMLGSGPLSPDHLDLLAAPGREAEVGAAVTGWLRGARSLLVDLTGVAEHHRVGGVFGTSAVVTDEDEAPYARLPGDYEAYLETLPPIMRNSIRRSGRKLARRGEVRFAVVERGDLEAALSRLRHLHTAQFGAESGLLPEFDRFAAAVRAGHPRGEIRLFELWVGDEMAAVDVAFTVAGRLSYYQGGRDLADHFSGAGTVLMARVVAWACAAGLTEVDFLRGTHAYKTQWARECRRVLRLRVGIGAAGQAVLGLDRLREAPAIGVLGRRVRAVARAVRLRRPVAEEA
jgi:CelD/BcsL family acetyltransferase involved in cellulose biosynthesis